MIVEKLPKTPIFHPDLLPGVLINFGERSANSSHQKTGTIISIL